MKTIRSSVPTLTLTRTAALGAFLVSGLLAASQFASAGSAPEAKGIAEGQAVVTELGGNARAVTYWTSGPDGAVVVTTVDTVSAAETDAERHAVVRFQSVLKPGQVQEISVPLAIGEQQPVLRIENAVGGSIAVATVSQ